MLLLLNQLVNQVHNLTLRTFHVGGTASNIADEAELSAKSDGIIEIEELRTVARTSDDGTIENYCYW